MEPSTYPTTPITPPVYTEPAHPAPVLAAKGPFRGRIGRTGYLLFLVYAVLAMVALIFLFFLGNKLLSSLGPVLNIFLALLSIVYVVGLIVLGIGVSVRRWHDLDQSGYFFFLGFVPIVGLVIPFILLLKPGTPSGNHYGPQPGKRLGPAQVLFGK